jgi:hypothetical protein
MALASGRHRNETTSSRSKYPVLHQNPGIPVIAISAQFRAGLSTAGTTAQTLGVEQVIAKPLTRDSLLGTVRAIIGPAV